MLQDDPSCGLAERLCRGDAPPATDGSSSRFRRFRRLPTRKSKCDHRSVLARSAMRIEDIQPVQWSPGRGARRSVSFRPVFRRRVASASAASWSGGRSAVFRRRVASATRGCWSYRSAAATLEAVSTLAARGCPGACGDRRQTDERRPGAQGAAAFLRVVYHTCTPAAIFEGYTVRLWRRQLGPFRELCVIRPNP